MQESKTRQVKIEDVRPDTFEHLLCFLHSGKMKIPLNEHLAQELYLASDKYDVTDLKEECMKFLQSSIKVNNVISMLAWADYYHVDKIKKICLAFPEHNDSKFLLYNTDFKELKLELRQKLINSAINKASSTERKIF